MNLTCPVCESITIVSRTSFRTRYRCKHGCYSCDILNESQIPIIFVLDYTGKNYLMFDFLHYNDNTEAIDWMKRKIERMIDYWKSNERYVARILTE
jgi:hypothetical protein